MRAKFSFANPGAISLSDFADAKMFRRIAK